MKQITSLQGIKCKRSSPRVSSVSTFKLVAPFLWIFLVGTAFASSATFLLGSFSQASSVGFVGLSSAQAPQSGETVFEATATDVRALKIESVFSKFKCPMQGTGEFLVQKADEHKIPYWLVASVAFQESGCGKKTPKVGGDESYNAWGYGVWGGNVKMFADWHAGISAVSRYFDVNFFSKGISDPCEIMKTYTPPSKGSWCEGVKYFGELITSFESE